MPILTLKGLHRGAAAKNRPAGYVEDVIAHATRRGDVITLTNEAFAMLRAKYDRLNARRGNPAPAATGKRAKATSKPQRSPENVGLRGRTKFEQDGSQHWARLHRSEPDPTALDAFTKSIPCGSCKTHWIALLKTLPPDFTSPDAYFEWTVHAHNAVNQRLGKPILPLWEARHLWNPFPAAFASQKRRMACPEAFLKLDGWENRYLGKACFLICGGPSLANVDPALLNAPGVLRFAVNNAAEVVRPHFWTHGDRPDNFLASIWMDPTIVKFIPKDRINAKLYDSQRGIPMDLRPRDCSPVVTYDKREEFKPDTFLTSSVVRWGAQKRSVMLAALRLVYAMGFARVYLVGVDWHMAADKQYAFDEQKNEGAQKSNNALYGAVGGYLAALRPVLEAAGMTVMNATAGSKLAAFDLIDVRLAGKECQLINLGGIDPAKEKTRGMYK